MAGLAGCGFGSTVDVYRRAGGRDLQYLGGGQALP